MISLILAMTEDYVIGQNTSLPWKIKEEIQYFSKITKNHAVLMGRKTFESIGHPLAERHNIVLTRDQKWMKKMKNKYPKLEIRDDLSMTIQNFANSSQQLFVIGGKEIFYQTYLHASQLYVSIIKEKYQGNVRLDFFPEMIKGFRLVKEQEFSQFLARIYAKMPIF